MSIFQSIILGIVQGFSEFLPISSSAHLVLIPAIFGWVFPEDQIFPFNVLVQLGTLVAVIIYFWSDLITMATAFFKGISNRKPFEDENSRLAWFIILATIPAGVIGLLLDGAVEAAFKNPSMAAVFLFITALMMWLAEHFSRQDRKLSKLNWIDTLLIGLSQALAIFPGISRSGATISMGMGRNLDRSSAGRFSFLMSIPIMLASGILGLKELLKVEDLVYFLPVMVIGFVTAGMVGYLSIRWLLRILKKQSLKIFSYYCVGFAVFSLLIGGLAEPSDGSIPLVIPEKPQVWTVQVSDAAEKVQKTFSLCEDAIPGVSLLVENRAVEEIISEPADFVFASDSFTLPGANVYMLYEESINVVTHFEVPAYSLTMAQLQDIFSGRLTDWKNVVLSSPYNGEIHRFGYSDGSDLQGAFSQLLGEEMIGERNIIPDPEVMFDSVLNTPYAIGFLPEWAASQSINVVEIKDEELKLEIVAYSQIESEKSVNWLKCLRSNLSH